MSDKDRQSRIELSFKQKLDIRNWMIENHSYIVKQQLTKGQTCDEIKKALNITCTRSHVDSISATIVELEFPFNEKPAATLEQLSAVETELKELKEHVGMYEIALEEFREKLKVVNDNCEGVRALVAEMRKSLNEALAAVELSVESQGEQIAAIHNTIGEMQMGFGRIAEKVGMRDFDDAIRRGVKSVAQSLNKKPT